MERSHRFGLFSGLAIFLVLWTVSAGTAAAGLDRPVRVGLYENAPKIYVDESGDPAGLFVRLIEAIAEREGWELEFVFCRWQECLRRLEAAELDLMPDVAFTEERSGRFAFHNTPVAYSWSVILKRDDTPASELSELDGRRVAVLAGAVQGGALEQMMTGLNQDYTVVEYPSYPRAFEAVRDGEADAVAANNFFAAYFAKRYGLRETPVVFDPATLYYATRPGDPLELLPAIDRRLEAWRYDQDSVYYSALETAMIPAQEPIVPPLVRYLLIAAVALLCLFLIMSGVLRWQVRRKTMQLRETTHRLYHMLRSSPVVLYQLALNGGYTDTRWVSDNIEGLFGFSPEEFAADDGWSRQLHPEDRDAVISNLAALPEKGRLVQEYRIVDARGKTRFVRDEMQYFPGRTGEPDEVVGSWNDLTDSRKQAARLSFLTHYDPLTRLPNRALFHERLTSSMNRAKREKRSLSVLFIDIDRFKSVNQSLGRQAGDAALKKVAERLTGALHNGENLARVGSDCFLILLEDAGRRTAVDTAHELIKRFAEPIRLGNEDVVLTVSVGISLFPDDGKDADTLLLHAEAAKNEAQSAGRNTYRTYYSSLSDGLVERLSIESAIRGAARNDELVLHYQPQVDLVTGEMVGVEALVRWQHAKLGLIPPGRFIPMAEEMGIIAEIGAWVLEEACRQMVDWREETLDIPCVSVNLSVQQLDSDVLLPLIRRVLDTTGIGASSLELEVTESMIMREPDRAAAALEGIREMGIRLAIDDFGTSYSSLNHLKHLPIDRLKIDRSFVRDTGTDENSRAISRTIIGLARSLELETVAEGIEDAEQLTFLRAEGCPVGQGYLFSRPLPADRVADTRRTLTVPGARRSGGGVARPA